MALFQKKPQISENVPLYTVGAHKTLLIIGLGNPGKKYAGSRHNIGFEVLDNFAAANDFAGWTLKKDLKAEIAIGALGQNRVVLLKPNTYMNLSGEAAQTAQHFYRVYNPQTLAIYDELAIPFGQLRTRTGGSDAGHNGVKSLVQHLGDDFGRLRVGIGSPAAQKEDAAKYVLKKFSKVEQGSLPLILQEASAVVTEFIFGEALPSDTRTLL